MGLIIWVALSELYYYGIPSTQGYAHKIGSLTLGCHWVDLSGQKGNK
jgi:hypothetical protein